MSQSFAAEIALTKSVSYTNKKTGLTITYPVIITLKIMAWVKPKHKSGGSKNEWENPTKNHYDIYKGSSWTCQRTYEIQDTANVSWKPDPIYYGGQKISFQQRNIS